MPQESVLLVMPEIAQINQIFHKKVGERNGNGTNQREKVAIYFIGPKVTQIVAFFNWALKRKFPQMHSQ
jgi:hypothetical protein